MIKHLKQLLEDIFSLPTCFVSEAAEAKWEDSVPCEYEGAFCDGCMAIAECNNKGKACKGEGND